MPVAIMQPTYLPWMGYFDLMDQADRFVFLDDVQFARRSWQQRNRIKTASGLAWLTVPVRVGGRYEQTVRDVEIDDAGFWRKHLRTIELSYRRAPHFDRYYAELASLFDTVPDRLVDVNVRLIEWLAKSFGIASSTVRASSLGTTGRRAEHLAAICEALGADAYLSAMGSSEYLLEESEAFERRGIAVTLQDYSHPEHGQLFPPFAPYASAIDLLFNEGENAIGVIRSGRGSLSLEALRERAP